MIDLATVVESAPRRTLSAPTPRERTDVAVTRLYGCRAYGVTCASETCLPGTEPLSPSAAAALRITTGPIVSTLGEVLWDTRFGEVPVRAEATPDGAHILRFGQRAAFSVARDGLTVRCASDGTARSTRFLLDTVLWWAALRRGLSIQHAAVVARDGCAVAIEAPSGCGKTTLAATLLSRGWSLVSDDVLVFERAQNGVIRALAGPPVMKIAAGFDGVQERPEELTVHPSGEDTPLVGYVQYARDANAGPQLKREAADPLAYFGASWAIPGHRNMAAHFEAMCDLAALVSRWTLSVTPNDQPHVAADLIESLLESVS